MAAAVLSARTISPLPAVKLLPQSTSSLLARGGSALPKLWGSSGLVSRVASSCACITTASISGLVPRPLEWRSRLHRAGVSVLSARSNAVRERREIREHTLLGSRLGMPVVVARAAMEEGGGGDTGRVGVNAGEEMGNGVTTTRTTVSTGTDDASTPSTSEKVGASSPSKVVRRRSATAPVEPVKVVGVEQKGVSVEGVAKIDRGDDDVAWGRIALLCAGDVLSLLVFAYIGKASHGSPYPNFEVVQVAIPFLAGWFLSSPFLGGYGVDAQGGKGVFPAAGVAAKTWAVGVPLGILIRSVAKGQLPPKPFVLVTLGATFILVVGWRSAFALTTGGKSGSSAKPGGNRRGNPLEFLDLLTSLIRRW